MNKAIPFVVGAAAGSLVTWLAVKQYYKRIADEEIESVVQRFKDRKIDGEIVHSAGLSIVEPHDITEEEQVTTTTGYSIRGEEYDKLLEENGYSSHPGDPNYAVFTDDKGDVPPFVIPPEEFGEADYNTKTFKFYSDFVLTDEEGVMITDSEELIGDALKHFGDYEDDAVYVRNVDVECDYEILKQDMTFSEAYGGSMDGDAI